MSRNTVDAMEWYLAIPTGGFVLMMLPTALNEQALFGIAHKFDLNAIICASEFLPLTSKLNIPVINSSVSATNEGKMADVTKDTVAAIYMTGGTTGAPKGVVLTHGALMRGAKNGTYKPGKVFYNKFIAMVPLAYIYGSVMGFLSCLYTGSAVYACSDMRSGIMNIPRLRPTILAVFPGLAEIILGIANLMGVAFLGDLTTLICGATHVSPRLMKQLKEFNIKLMVSYGLTEGAGLTSVNCDFDKNPDSMGAVYPEQEYKVVDDELWIRGDNLMKCYYKDKEKTAAAFTEDGWFKTGDLVSFDDAGFVTVIGRINNLITLDNGENVSPEKIEKAFYKEHFIKDCIVKEMDKDGGRVIGIEVLPFLPLIEGKSDDEISKITSDTVEKVNEQLPPCARIGKTLIRKEDFRRSGAMKIIRE